MHPLIAEKRADIAALCRHYHVRHLEVFGSAARADDFAETQVIHSAVERKFEIIGEALNQLSKADHALASRIPRLAEIVAFRNLLIHGYAAVEHPRCLAHHPRVAAHAARHGGPIARRTGAALKRQDSRNDTLASLAGHLLWHGVDPVVALDLLLARNAFRCRPPLSEDEVARAVDSIAPARAARRRPRVSTSGRETRCGSGLARDQRR